MAALTPQERQQAFAANFEQLVQKLAETYGFQPVALIQSRQLNGGMIQAEAVIGVQPVPGWQPPQEPEQKFPATTHESIPVADEVVATATPSNGKHKPR